MREFLTMHPGLVLVAPFVGAAIVLVIATSLQRQGLFWRTISHNVEVAKQHLVAAKAFEREADLAAAGYAPIDMRGLFGAAEVGALNITTTPIPLVDSDSGDVEEPGDLREQLIEAGFGGDIEEMGEAEAIAFMAVEEPRPDPTLSWVDVYVRPTFSRYNMPSVVAENRETGEVTARWETHYRDNGYSEMLDRRKRHKLEMG